MQGVMELREAIATKIESLYNAQYCPDSEITITAGATQAIFTAITALIKENDEVIIFTPAYDCYGPSIELNGGKPVYIQLQLPEYTINWEDVRKMVTSKTKMIIINTPHNPSGTVLTDSDMTQLENLVDESDIVVLSDEVYEHIIFDNLKHCSVTRYPRLASRSLAVYSFGKTFHNTGWKMGYCIGPKELMAEFRKVHQFNVFSCNTPMQFALASYISNEQNYLDLSPFYEKKRDLFLEMISESRFKFTPAKGTYFQVLDYSEITSEIDTEYAISLTEKNKLASIPVSVFYNKRVQANSLRFCFAKRESTLEQAAIILNKI